MSGRRARLAACAGRRVQRPGSARKRRAVARGFRGERRHLRRRLDRIPRLRARGRPPGPAPGTARPAAAAGLVVRLLRSRAAPGRDVGPVVLRGAADAGPRGGAGTQARRTAPPITLGPPRLCLWRLRSGALGRRAPQGRSARRRATSGPATSSRPTSGCGSGRIPRGRPGPVLPGACRGCTRRMPRLSTCLAATWPACRRSCSCAAPGRTVATRPIKGTRRRSSPERRAAAQRRDLEARPRTGPRT